MEIDWSIFSFRIYFFNPLKRLLESSEFSRQVHKSALHDGNSEPRIYLNLCNDSILLQ